MCTPSAVCAAVVVNDQVPSWLSTPRLNEPPFGTPVILGRKGIEEIREIALWPEERDLLEGACQAINGRLKGI